MRQTPNFFYNQYRAGNVWAIVRFQEKDIEWTFGLGRINIKNLPKNNIIFCSDRRQWEIDIDFITFSTDDLLVWTLEFAERNCIIEVLETF